MSDLRLPALGAAAWAGGLLAALAFRDRLAAGVLALLVLAGAGVALLRGGPAVRVTVLAAVLVASAVTAAGMLRQHQVAANPVADLARQRALAEVVGVVSSDPRTIQGAYGDRVLVRVSARSVTVAGGTVRLRTPVLVFGDPAWADVPLGATVRATARLGPADDPDVTAFATPRDPPEVVAGPDLWWRGAAAVRASIRSTVEHRPTEQRALVPALVDGDDGEIPPALAEDFRTTGLTHLLAVSGTNLTLVVGFLLAAARWCRVRGRWLTVVAALGIVGFVLLARTEPSVVRAAAMGTVGLLAMSANGRQRGLRGLGAAVVGLLLLQPGLAVSVGFALSVLATGGILLLGPPWRDALARWLPRWLAEAVAVPTAAQLACTPLVAAISGEVSLAAVGANLLAEPAVGPATVLGLLGGLLALVWEPLGRVPGTMAGWCVAWIVAVAERGADLPLAAVGWGTGTLALAVLTAAVVALGVLGPRLVRHRSVGVGCCLLLVVVVTVRLPTPGWPPDGWVLVACDVGQGDALAVRTGPGSALVVDAGPDGDAVDRCLDGLGVRDVPLAVLTHFHADHVDGFAGVLSGRRVGVVETSPVADPPEAAEEVARLASAAGVAARPAPYGVTRRVGDATVQVLWPRAGPGRRGPGDGSTANDASVVLLVEVAGLRLLLTGDVEPPGQQALARALPGLQVDVLKVPHHGSRYQEMAWLLALGARVTLTSVGEDNDYGHPASSTLDPFEAAGAEVVRTDRDGTVAVVARADGPEVVAR